MNPKNIIFTTLLLSLAVSVLDSVLSGNVVDAKVIIALLLLWFLLSALANVEPNLASAFSILILVAIVYNRWSVFEKILASRR